ncbi:MAG: peptide MFS transporter [Phycisphaerales bacterium]
MWERFSYYGMRGLLMLYLISVFSIHQLKPGVYTNVLTITQIQDVEGQSTPSELATESRSFHILVGQPPGSTPPETTPSPGTLPLTIQRLSPVLAPDPNNPGSQTLKEWTPDSSAASAEPVVIHAQTGTKLTDAQSTFKYRITNPTDQPIKIRAGILRSDNSRTYFTVNDEPGDIVIEVKPESRLTPDDKPVELTIATNNHDSGRNWSKPTAAVLYGWYTGLAYLFPILGGIIADKLIGTHRSMLVGGVLIALGHIILGISGFGDLAYDRQGMALFIMGLAVIVLGTGHFKPCVSVMVGQLYPAGDPRRDGAFTIFYMGINLGAFICAFVCGTLGEKVGWHYGFASAAVGMILGLVAYIIGKPVLLKGIGDAPKPNPGGASMLFLVGSIVVSALFAGLYYIGTLAKLGELMDSIQARPVVAWSIIAVLIAGILAWTGWFLSINRAEDRGPVLTIFIFMLFNAFFWIAFEQAGSSINVFTKNNTDRMLGSFEVPATWFQSVNAGLIFILAPVFAVLWTRLGRRKLNPSQPVKIALGLIFLGLGYLFMVWAGKIAVGGVVKASMLFVLLTYFWHTVGELCLSPTGLSYVTKAAPVKFVSLLMGIWFVSSFIANLGGGLIAAQVEAIEKGTLKLPWNFGGQADFFFLFVVTSIGAGVVILLLTPLLKPMMRGRDA